MGPDAPGRRSSRRRGGRCPGAARRPGPSASRSDRGGRVRRHGADPDVFAPELWQAARRRRPRLVRPRSRFVRDRRDGRDRGRGRRRLRHPRRDRPATVAVDRRRPVCGPHRSWRRREPRPGARPADDADAGRRSRGGRWMGRTPLEAATFARPEPDRVSGRRPGLGLAAIRPRSSRSWARPTRPSPSRG